VRQAGTPFVTPLSGLALELLRPHLKNDPDAPLLPFPRYALHGAAQRIVRKLGMQRWTPHDLRRTAATILDREGYSLEQIGTLLAHTRKGVTAVYARWDKFDLKREMATVLERSLREILQVQEVENSERGGVSRRALDEAIRRDRWCKNRRSFFACNVVSLPSTNFGRWKHLPARGQTSNLRHHGGRLTGSRGA